MKEHIKSYVIAFTIASIGIFYLATIRPGISWEGDSFMYIRHAMNIVHGVRYDKIGFILNPDNMISPKAYPPGYPLLLVPVYIFFGLNITAIKAEICLIFLVFLVFLVQLVRERISFASLLGLLAIFSLHPSILQFRGAIMSDIPFLLFTYWALFLIHRLYKSEYFRTGFFPAVYLGVVIYLSYGTRSGGIVLLPVLLIYEFIHWRRISAHTLITLCIFSFLAVIQWIFFNSEGDYLKSIVHRDMLLSIRDNLHSFFFFWEDDYYPKIQIVILSSMMFFALSGFITQVRRKLMVTEVFFVFYLSSMFCWPPFEGARYFIPIIPLFIFYLLCGVEFWASKTSRPPLAAIRNMILIGLLGLFVYSYGLRYRDWDYRSIPEGPYKQESQELFKFVREKTPKDAVFIFLKPRILAFFTDRQASVYHYPVHPEDLWKYMHTIGARYLVEGTMEVFCQEDKYYLSSFIKRYQKQLRLVFINKDFQVFEETEETGTH